MHFSLGLFAFDLSYIIKRAKKGGENVSYFKKGGGKMRKVVSLLISLVVMVSCLRQHRTMPPINSRKSS